MLNLNHSLDRKEFGNRIRKARKEKGLTQADLRNALQMSDRTTVSNWENGKALPDLSRVQEICNALDVDIGYLLAEYDEYTIESHAIAEKTGLSGDAIAKLEKWHSGTTTLSRVNGRVIPKCWCDYLSLMITSPTMDMVMHNITQGLLTAQLFDVAEKKDTVFADEKTKKNCRSIRIQFIEHNRQTADLFKQIIQRFRFEDSTTLNELTKTKH